MTEDAPLDNPLDAYDQDFEIMIFIGALVTVMLMTLWFWLYDDDSLLMLVTRLCQKVILVTKLSPEIKSSRSYIQPLVANIYLTDFHLIASGIIQFGKMCLKVRLTHMFRVFFRNHKFIGNKKI